MPSQFFGLVALMLVEYGSMLLIFRYYKCLFYSCSESQQGVISPLDFVQQSPCPLRFESTHESFTGPLRYTLFVTRFLSLIYILGVSVIVNDVTMPDDRGWLYFTNWNTKLIAFYFLLAFISSVTGLLSPSNVDLARSASSTSAQNGEQNCYLSIYVRTFTILFEVAGGTSILVTVVAFGILDHSLSFWNVSLHLVTLITLLVELSLNKIFVRYDHYPFNLSWATIYLVFIWILVYSGQQDWPYFFLKTDSPNCYLFYSGLILADLLFYTIWYSFSELKLFMLNRINTTMREKNLDNSNLEARAISLEYSPILIDDATIEL